MTVISQLPPSLFSRKLNLRVESKKGQTGTKGECARKPSRHVGLGTVTPLCAWVPVSSPGSLCLQFSIQRGAFDRAVNLAQSGGPLSTAHAPTLTLLVRQLLFFYKQSEDSKRLVSARGLASRAPDFQLLLSSISALLAGCSTHRSRDPVVPGPGRLVPRKLCPEPSLAGV